MKPAAKRVSVTLPPTAYKALEAYRVSRGLRSLNAAVNSMIDEASRRS